MPTLIIYGDTTAGVSVRRVVSSENERDLVPHLPTHPLERYVLLDAVQEGDLFRTLGNAPDVNAAVRLIEAKSGRAAVATKCAVVDALGDVVCICEGDPEIDLPPEEFPSHSHNLVRHPTAHWIDHYSRTDRKWRRFHRGAFRTLKEIDDENAALAQVADEAERDKLLANIDLERSRDLIAEAVARRRLP